MENSWKKKNWKQKPNNLLSVLYIKDLPTNKDSVGDCVDKHDDPLATFSDSLNNYDLFDRKQ